MKAILTLMILLGFIAPVWAGTVGDDFNDNSVDPSKWGAAITSGGASFTESLQRLNYNGPKGLSAGAQPWKLTQLPYSANWEIRFDVYNGFSLLSAGEEGYFGFFVQNGRDLRDDVSLTAYCKRPEQNKSSIFGFLSYLTDNGSTAVEREEPLNVRQGSLRMAFNATTKVITTYVTPAGSGEVQIASFGIAGSGGTNGNAFWGMTEDDTFSVAIVGWYFSINHIGGSWGDNFSITTANHPPTGIPDSYNTGPETALNVAAPGVLGNDFDVEGAPLTATLGSDPLHAASFTLNPDGSFDYTPVLGFSGLDSFTYRAYDGAMSSRLVRVLLSVGRDTPTGDDVMVELNALSLGAHITVFFPRVTTAGSTTVTQLDPSEAGTVDVGYEFFDSNLVFDIATTGDVTGPIVVCFALPGVLDANTFAKLRILHRKTGFLQDRTIQFPDTPSPNFITRTLCARVPSLSPFAIVLSKSASIEPHDLAVIKLKAPKKVTLKAGALPKPGKVQVSIQNLGPNAEVILSESVLSALVQLNVESLGDCPDPQPTLVSPTAFPITLAPKKKLNLSYQVVIDCPNDPAAGVGHEDYRYTVNVKGYILYGFPDTNVGNDVCPRPPSGTDPGCGGMGGTDVLTDVFMN